MNRGNVKEKFLAQEPNVSATAGARRWFNWYDIKPLHFISRAVSHNCQLRRNMPTLHSFWFKSSKEIEEHFQTRVNALNPDGNYHRIVNIVIGRISQAINVGKNLVSDFEESRPAGFHNPLNSKVKTMSIGRKKVKVEAEWIIDAGLFHARYQHAWQHVLSSTN